MERNNSGASGRREAWTGLLLLSEIAAGFLVLCWSFVLILILAMSGPNGAFSGLSDSAVSLINMVIFFGVPGIWVTLTARAHRRFIERGSRAPLLTLVMPPIVLTAAVAVALWIWAENYPDVLTEPEIEFDGR